MNTQTFISLALEEDIKTGDVTTQALFNPDSPIIQAKLIAKQAGVLSGMTPAKNTFLTVDPTLTLKELKQDGDWLEPYEAFLSITGSAASILTAERTALNFLQNLSGIATRTYQFVQAIAGTQTKILDTRKTIPGFRLLAKDAVKHGGGKNHRFGLYDAYLIKDNHLALYPSIAQAIQAVRKHNNQNLKIEVEVDTLSQLEEAIQSQVDWVLLDNMPLEDLRLAVMRRNKIAVKQAKPLLEASGNVNLQNVRAIAQTGVDYISIGGLTHSAPALDLSLEIENENIS